MRPLDHRVEAGHGRRCRRSVTGDWQAAFEKYQAIPQYRALNGGMSLDAFKTIYWWEWTHRLLGRLIGAAFLLPFLWFLWRGWVAPALRPRLWFIFGLGALQGAVGWWMVASGLAERVEVSQYRLATHLILACADLRGADLDRAAAVLPIACSACVEARSPPRLRVSAAALLVLVLAQIYLGALVAGLRAGYAYNTWPLIDGALVPVPPGCFSTRRCGGISSRMRSDRAVRPPHAGLWDLRLCGCFTRSTSRVP